MKNKVYVFLFDGYSDWEIGYTLPEMKKTGKFSIEFVSMNKETVQSMGGLKVLTNISPDEVEAEHTAVFILPGGTAWEEKKYRELIPFIRKFQTSGIPIAAICGATVLLAEAGLLKGIRHTSNGAAYLLHYAPDYPGAERYLEQPAVSDQNVITASGTAPIEFAREIFKILGLFAEKDMEKWYKLFKEGIWIAD